MELLHFLRSNNVEDATEADTAYIIKYFDSDQDSLLDPEDLLYLVLPCDNPHLRSAIAQRDIAPCYHDERLDDEVEYELTKLFEKEIFFNRALEELKQRI